MPKVRRQNIPPALLQHLPDRIQSRKIPANQLELLAKWLDTEPDVPEGRWYKRFPGRVRPRRADQDLSTRGPAPRRVSDRPDEPGVLTTTRVTSIYTCIIQA